jgi:hypothetical protein
MPGSSATDLLNCPALAAIIIKCQKAGKKVYLSMGGFAGNVDHNSTTDPNKHVTQIWDIFGGGKSAISRSFGDVMLEGSMLVGILPNTSLMHHMPTARQTPNPRNQPAKTLRLPPFAAISSPNRERPTTIPLRPMRRS